MYNYYRDDVFRRYAETMSQVFGHDPCFDDVDARSGPRRQAVLTVSSDASALDCETRAISTDDAPAPSTDDHPFPYVPGRTIPPFYLGWLGGILLASVLVVRLASGAPLGQMSPYVDLFFMGAAFLLLETKSVVQFALLFGTTWFVNSLVFAGILVSVLAAIEVARRIRRPNPILMYGALLACLGVAWIVPVRRERARGVRSGVRREPHLRGTVPRGGLIDGGLRREPARCHAGRRPGIPRDRDRLPHAARGGRAAVRARVRHGSPSSCLVQRVKLDRTRIPTCS
jgi:hypothetical protein